MRQRKQLFLAACAALMLMLPAVDASAEHSSPSDGSRGESRRPLLEQLPAASGAGLSDTAAPGGGRTILTAAVAAFQAGAQSGGAASRAVVSARQASPYREYSYYAVSWFACAGSPVFGASHCCRAPPAASSFPV